MCMGGGGSDDSAEEARIAEEARQKRIGQGTEAINAQFARFDEPFFQNVEQAALDYYNPQVQDQFGTAKDKTIKRLAREGNLEASAGINQLGDLADAANQGFTDVSSKARGIANNQRANVEQTRSRLLSQLSATADPVAAAAAAQQSALVNTAPPEYSPIADLFSKFTNQAALQVGAANQGYKNVVSPYMPRAGGYSVINT